MQQPERTRAMLRDTSEAVLLDRDGGITDTPSRHATCWTQLCDASLQQCAADTRAPLRPCEIATDDRRDVDGKPRFDGVRDFLTSRGIHLPEAGHRRCA